MTDREQVESQIRETIASETQAVRLSQTLFAPDGLFNRLANSTEERQALTRSLLFKQAQRLLSDLQQKEAADFSHALQQSPCALPTGEFLIKSEEP
jgi:hypothetical protein